MVTNREFNDTLVYAGVLCLLMGGLSILGQKNNSSDLNYFQSRSVGAKSVTEIN